MINYLGGPNLSSGYAHLLSVSQLDREDDLVLAGSDRADQILIFPVLLHQHLHITWNIYI